MDQRCAKRVVRAPSRVPNSMLCRRDAAARSPMLAHFSKTWLLFTVWCLLSPALAHADAQDFSGTVGKIFDGDSFLVRPARGRDVDVRLQDIDAPEKTQPYGNAARAALVALIGGRSVFVDVIETDRYGRKVVRVYREPDRLDVIEALVREGHVWVYRRTVHDRSLIGLEEAARAQRRGLWALPATERMPPWRYRYHQRHKARRTSVVRLDERLVGSQAAAVGAGLERAQASGFHQSITPVAAGVLIAPGAEGRGEAGAGWAVVVP